MTAGRFPSLRMDAIEKLKTQESDIANLAPSKERNLLLGGWTPIGPAPIIAGRCKIFRQSDIDRSSSYKSQVLSMSAPPREAFTDQRTDGTTLDQR